MRKISDKGMFPRRLKMYVCVCFSSGSLDITYLFQFMFMLPPRSHRAFIAAAACFQQNQIMANGSAPPTEILRRCVRRRAVPCHHCAADSRPAGCNCHKVCQVFSVQVAFALQRFPLYKQEVLQTGSCIFESSACVEHADVFVSHRWGSGRWAKYCTWHCASTRI